jgi:hypothetical protein
MDMTTLWRIGVPSRALPDDAVAYLLAADMMSRLLPAYVGAERVECRHDELAAGQRWPVCGQSTLYALPSGVEIRIDGHALLSATRYELQKLRCSACGTIFSAALPDEAGQT